MAVPLIRQELATFSGSFVDESEFGLMGELGTEDEHEVLEFLAVRPVHTVYMASLIRDNGLVSPNNRGSFYACRDAWGKLEGVALLGHAILIEARSEKSLSAFAGLARNCENVQLIRGERETTDRFWRQYASAGQEPRRICSEVLLEQRQASPPDEDVALRQATTDDLEKVLWVNATMAFQEGGSSPLQRDPEGFRQRTAARIERGRVWVWIQEDKLIFKADVIAHTPQVTYLEGVHVHEKERHKGYGFRCLNQLSSVLLADCQSVCLTANQRNQDAVALYERAGYQFLSDYETIYLR